MRSGMQKPHQSQHFLLMCKKVLDFQFSYNKLQRLESHISKLHSRVIKRRVTGIVMFNHPELNYKSASEWVAIVSLIFFPLATAFIFLSIIGCTHQSNLPWLNINNNETVANVHTDYMLTLSIFETSFVSDVRNQTASQVAKSKTTAKPLHLFLLQLLVIYIIQAVAAYLLIKAIKQECKIECRKRGRFWQSLTTVCTTAQMMILLLGFYQLHASMYVLFGMQMIIGFCGTCILHKYIGYLEIPDNGNHKRADLLNFISTMFLARILWETLILSITGISFNRPPIEMVNLGIQICSRTVFVVTTILLLAARVFSKKRVKIIQFIYGTEVVGISLETFLVVWNSIRKLHNHSVYLGISFTFLITASLGLVALRIYLVYLIYQAYGSKNSPVLQNIKQSIMETTALKPKTINKIIRKIQNVEIDEDTKLGEGFFGTVFKGCLKRNRFRFDIAIKLIKSSENNDRNKMVCEEIKISLLVGKHPHVVFFHGISAKGDDLWILFEYCNEGNLESYLRKLKPQMESETKTAEIVGRLKQFSKQIALGMNHLAERKIIHGDLSSRNVLLTSDLTVKLTDFGLSRKLNAHQLYIKANQGENPYLPWRWMALETLRDLEFSEKTDVYSYGIILWEIFSLGSIPFSGISWSSDFVSSLQNGLILDCPIYACIQFYDMMLTCWELDPKRRPSFKYILSIYNVMHTE